MRYFKLCAAASLYCLSLTSCFKDEPLNAECDIEQAYIHAENPQEMFYYLSDTLVNVQSDQTDIVFTMQEGQDYTALAPIFHLTPGATISPENGSTQDFSQGPVTYTVTSEDKKWSRTYNVSVNSLMLIKGHLDCNFEYANTDGKWTNWYQENETNGNVSLISAFWATGNSGYNKSNKSSPIDKYPTIVDENSYDGKGVTLITRRTSKIADLVKKPIAAGNLFIGSFDPTDALKNAMKATKFGKPFAFSSKPARFSGYYQYSPGETYTDKNLTPIEGVTDKGSIYAVLYNNHDEDGNAVVLYGDNVQTSPQIVALAIVPEVNATTDWTAFDIPFQYFKSIDETKLKNGGYSMSIVSSSSDKGAEFMGAIGSTLRIDKFKITCEEEVNTTNQTDDK